MAETTSWRGVSHSKVMTDRGYSRERAAMMVRVFSIVNILECGRGLMTLTPVIQGGFPERSSTSSLFFLMRNEIMTMHVMMLHSGIKYSGEVKSISFKNWEKKEMREILDEDREDGCMVGVGEGEKGGGRKWRGATGNRVQP